LEVGLIGNRGDKGGLLFSLRRKNMMVTKRMMMMASRMAIGNPIAKP